MSEPNGYRHLEARPGSTYRQLFLKGRRLRAESLYRESVGVDPRTPAQLAEDFELPLDAVLEAIDYSERHEDLLRAERERDWADIRRRGLDRPPLAPVDPANDA